MEFVRTCVAPRPGSMRTAAICTATARPKSAPSRGTIHHAAPRYFRAHGPARGAERGRSTDDRHVPAVTARYRAPAPCVDRTGAVHHFRLSDWFRCGTDFLWPGLGPARTQAGSDGGYCAVLRGESRLRAVHLD